MAVAFQDQEAFAFPSAGSPSFTFTPPAQPQGVWVMIGYQLDDADNITGVTYGGIAMTRVAFAAWTGAGEQVASWAYFLGSGIPSGAQTVTLTITGGVTVTAQAGSVTAATDTEVLVTASTNGNTSAAQSPGPALDTGAVTAIRFGINSSGQNVLANLTAGTGTTSMQGVDHGNQCIRSTRETTPSSGSFNYGFGNGNETFAVVAFAVQEVAAAGADPYPYVGGGYYPTEG